MFRLLKLLSFMVGWLGAFLVVYLNHVVLVDGGYDIDLFGIIIIAFSVLMVLKRFDKTVDLWRIHKTNRKITIIYDNLKKIIIVVFLTWALYTIEDDIVKLQWSGVLISTCFIVGMLLSLWAEFFRKDK